MRISRGCISRTYTHAHARTLTRVQTKHAQRGEWWNRTSSIYISIFRTNFSLYQTGNWSWCCAEGFSFSSLLYRLQLPSGVVVLSYWCVTGDSVQRLASSRSRHCPDSVDTVTRSRYVVVYRTSYSCWFNRFCINNIAIDSVQAGVWTIIEAEGCYYRSRLPVTSTQWKFWERIICVCVCVCFLSPRCVCVSLSCIYVCACFSLCICMCVPACGRACIFASLFLSCVCVCVSACVCFYVCVSFSPLPLVRTRTHAHITSTNVILENTCIAFCE